MKSIFIFSWFNILIILFYWIVISFLILIFVFDLKYQLIPDKISIPAIIIIFIFQIILSLIRNNYELQVTSYGLLLLAAIIISGFFALQFILSKGKWIGGGDIRLGFLMGIILGWPMGLLALFLAYIGYYSVDYFDFLFKSSGFTGIIISMVLLFGIVIVLLKFNWETILDRF